MAFLLLHWDTLYESESLPQLSSQCRAARRRKEEEDEDDPIVANHCWWHQPFLSFQFWSFWSNFQGSLRSPCNCLVSLVSLVSLVFRDFSNFAAQKVAGGVPQAITVIITSPPSCRAASQLPFFVASLVLERQRWEVGNAWLVECPISVKTRQMINHSILTGNRVIFC